MLNWAVKLTGDLVSPSFGVLTTLVSLDPVHTSFSVSERERLAMGLLCVLLAGTFLITGFHVNTALFFAVVFSCLACFYCQVGDAVKRELALFLSVSFFVG